MQKRNKGISYCPFYRFSPRMAYLKEQTERYPQGVYTKAPKSVRKGTSTLGTLRLRMIYTSVGVTSAFVFVQGLNFRGSSGQKQSVQCRLFRNVVLRPSAPYTSVYIVATRGRCDCKYTKKNPNTIVSGRN